MGDDGSAFELQCQALVYSVQALERAALEFSSSGSAAGAKNTAIANLRLCGESLQRSIDTLESREDLATREQSRADLRAAFDKKVTKDAARKEEATDPRGEVGSPRSSSPKSVEQAATSQDVEPPSASTSLDPPDETSVARESKEEEEEEETTRDEEDAVSISRMPKRRNSIRDFVGDTLRKGMGIGRSVRGTAIVRGFITESTRNRQGEGGQHNELAVVEAKAPYFLFHPENMYHIVWDIFMMFLIFYYAFAVPIRICFDIEVNPDNMWLEWFFNVCFGLDILVNFNTAYTDMHGIHIVERSKIARNYLRAWFWIDLAATFPFDLVTGGGSGSSGAAKLGRSFKILRLMRIFKLLRLLKLGRIVQRLKQSTHMNPNILLLGRLVAALIGTLHIMACCYWIIVREQIGKDPYGREVRLPAGCDVEDNDACQRLAISGDDEQWMPPYYILENRLDEQYAYSFFWALSVTTGAGWDIIPATIPEIAYSSVMILVGTFVYITILGALTSIISNFNVAQQQKMAQLDAVLAHLRQNKAPQGLIGRIRGYYDFLWADDSSNAASKGFTTEVATLPRSLQLELFQEINRAYFAKVPILNMLPPMAIFVLAKYWKRAVYLNNDVIVSEGDIIRALHIVLRGKVRMSIKLQVGMAPMKLVDLDEGGFFGEECCRLHVTESAQAPPKRGKRTSIADTHKLGLATKSVDDRIKLGRSREAHAAQTSIPQTPERSTGGMPASGLAEDNVIRQHRRPSLGTGQTMEEAVSGNIDAARAAARLERMEQRSRTRMPGFAKADALLPTSPTNETTAAPPPVQMRYLCTVRSIGYCELLNIPADAYGAVAEEFEGVAEKLEPLLVRTERSRQVRLRWRKACAKVILANRFKMVGHLTQDEPESSGVMSVTQGFNALSRSVTRGFRRASKTRKDSRSTATVLPA